MIIMIFLTALAVLITNTLQLSYFIDTNHLAEKTDTILSFVLAGALVIIVFMGVSIPLILFIAKSISTPVEKMLDKTHYDALTGIYNRRYVDENLKNLINFMSRSDSKLTLLILDIDFFKSYNDTYGYNKGDTCLQIVAHALVRSVARTEDFVARYGSKEFVVVLPNTDENGAHTISQKLLAVIRECKIPHEKSSAANYVTVSIGATTGKADFSQNGDDYLNRASEMLHKSIENGYNQYTFAAL